MNNRRREIAKFVCGFETFHTLVHAYLWLTGTTLTFLGFAFNPASSIIGTVVNAVIAIWLGMYGWRTGRPSGTQAKSDQATIQRNPDR